MKKRFLLTALSILWLCSGMVSVRAQGPGMSPAMAVGEKLQAQAEAATAYADRLQNAGDAANATVQREIARRRGLQASRKFQETMASRLYGRTATGAEAAYHLAQSQATYLHDKYSAVQTLKNLHNTHANVSFPDRPAAEVLLARLEKEVDAEYQRPQPGFMGQLYPVLYRIMDFFVHLTGAGAYSYVAAIFMLTVLVRLALTPFSNKQYASMKEQQKLQPVLKEIQAKYKNDKETQMRKVQEMYKEHGVNPFAGCFPSLASIPFFFLMYQMIRVYEYHFTSGYFLWIGSSFSHAFPNLLAVNLSQMDVPLLIVYALSMYVQQKMLTPPPTDDAQAEQQRMMAILFPFMSTYFFFSSRWPSAFVLYYLILNILSTAQQYYYLKKRAAAERAEGDGAKLLPVAPEGGNGMGSAKARPAKGANGVGSRRVGGSAAAPLAEAKENVLTEKKNGVAPAARGIIAPPKVHPKKKRR